jgi:3-oxoacyl-(acyl-carrier-protein) synthase
MNRLQGMTEVVELPIKVSAVSVLCPSGMNEQAAQNPPCSGEVPNFKARSMVPDRKNLKLMTQAVRLGVASIASAVQQVSNWENVPPSRRGMYVGASPQVGHHDDLTDAVNVAFESGTFSLNDFGAKGIHQIHPLWLVRGLSNNVLGFSSAYHDVQGHNMSYAMGVAGGWNAILEGAYALVEGRVDIVVVGGSDDLTPASDVLGAEGSAGAAFCVLERADTSMQLDARAYLELAEPFGLLGAATIPIGMALHEFGKRQI